MNWKGKHLRTIGDVMEHGIDKCATKEEAREFMELLCAEHSSARQDIGYLSGYYSAADAKRIREWFEVTHPIFGNSSPTQKEAYEAGLRMGEAARAKAEGK